jgi:hypothetical protein
MVALVVAGCGTSGDTETACDLLPSARAASEVRDAAGEPVRLRRQSSESLDQSICRYVGRGTNVGLNVDSAPEVRRRYFNRVTEALQLSSNDPGRRPQPVPGLGDDDALGPAGAYWIPDYRQLFVLRGSRQFVLQFSVRGAGAAEARRAAERIAADTLPGERTVRAAERPSGRPVRLELVVAAPRPGETVRSRSVVVRGTVAGPAPTVEVQGRRAPVVGGTFAAELALPRGRTRIRVVARTRAGQRAARTFEVSRGRSPRAVGAAFARRRPGRMPDLLAARLPDARALLTGAAIRYRVVRLADARLPDRSWSVCATRPAPGARLPRGRPVLLRVDAEDPFRASGTACAQE